MTFAFAQFGTGDIATAYIPTTTAAVSVGPVANVPRLDYLGSSCPRLLLEPQRSNLLVYSEQFNDASWLKTAASITANTTISPDGYSNADTLTEDNTSNLHRALDYISAVTGSTYTASIFCKAGSGTRNLAILFGCGFGEQEVVFNVNNGTIVSSSNATGTITPYGNGWYRCTATATSQQTTTICVQYQLRDGVNQIYQGNGTSSLIIYGAMAELGAYATSYIPTLAATVTRVADFYAKAGFGNTSTAGTLYYEFQNYQSPAAANGFYMVCLFAGSTITDNFFSAAESISIINNGFAIEGRNDGYATTLFSFTPAINATVKIALRYDGTNVVAFVNGVKGTVFSDTAVGAKNAIRVNNGENATHATKQLLYFPSALTDDQLAALTTL